MPKNLTAIRLDIGGKSALAAVIAEAIFNVTILARVLPVAINGS